VIRRFWMLGVLFSAVVSAAGCSHRSDQVPSISEAQESGNATDGSANALQATPEPLTPSDLRVQIAVGARDRAGFSVSLRYTFTNISTRSGLFVPPAPMPGNRREGPGTLFRVVGIIVCNAAGKELPEGPRTIFVLTDVDAEDWPNRQNVLLNPGQSFEAEYQLSRFYPWGPCNPVRDSSLSALFRPGDTEIQLRGVVYCFPDEKEHIESKRLTLRAFFDKKFFVDR
jgi:hypothetical protein